MKNSSKKYHVMHVVDSLEVGGMENGVVNIANHIDKEQFRISVCCLSHPGRLSTRIKDGDIAIISLGWSGGFSLKLIFELARVFNKQNVDIIHTHGWQTLIYCSVASLLSGVPVLINGEHGRFHLEKLRRRVAYKIISTMVDKYVTVSKSLENKLVMILPAASRKVVTIPNGVDLLKFVPQTKDAAESIKSGLGLPATSLVIGHVGRLEPVKNHQMLLNAFASLCREFENLHCVLIGDGILRSSLENLVKQLGVSDRVHFIGRVENPHQLMPIFDVFVSTSLNEGMSNVILEAMACGKPIVATDVGDNGKLVEASGNGFLVQVEDSTLLESSIKLLLTDKDLNQRFGVRSRNLVEEKFGIMNMVSSYQETYLEAIVKKRGPHDL